LGEKRRSNAYGRSLRDSKGIKKKILNRRARKKEKKETTRQRAGRDALERKSIPSHRRGKKPECLARREKNLFNHHLKNGENLPGEKEEFNEKEENWGKKQSKKSGSS